MKDEKINSIGYFWIARDKTSNLFLHFTKPRLCGSVWCPQEGSYARQIDTDLFPEVTFENSPKKVKVTIEMENE